MCVCGCGACVWLWCVCVVVVCVCVVVVCVCVHDCVKGLGLVIDTVTTSCFSCQKLIKGPLRLKFGMWSANKLVSVINHMCIEK